MPVHDLTGGFKCFHREVLEALDLTAIGTDGYGFQIEMTYRAIRAGFRVAEVPIYFRDRRVGASKMSARIASRRSGRCRRCAFGCAARRPRASWVSPSSNRGRLACRTELTPSRSENNMALTLKKSLLGIAALAALALGGSALAQAGDDGSGGAGAKDSEAAEQESPANERYDRDDGDEGKDDDGGEPGNQDERASGPGADRAKAAALRATGGGEANAVERDTEGGGTWEVEVTRSNGKTVDVRLDEAYQVIEVEGDGEEAERSR